MRTEPYHGTERTVPESDLERAVLSNLIESRIRAWEDGTGRTLTIVSVEDGIWTVEEREGDALQGLRAAIDGAKPRAVWRLWVTSDATVEEYLAR